MRTVDASWKRISTSVTSASTWTASPATSIESMTPNDKAPITKSAIGAVINRALNHRPSSEYATSAKHATARVKTVTFRLYGTRGAVGLLSP